jgi:phage-related protein
MILNSGQTNITNISAFELGNNYSKFDIVYYSGYTDSSVEYPAAQNASGHYYYTGAAATSTASNLPITANGPWTNKFFSESSYGSTVSYKNEYYGMQFGDGYFSNLSKSENSLTATFNIDLNKRSDKEAKAVIHLFEDSFNKGNKPSGGYTGIYWTPFPPYDREHEFYIEQFDNDLEYPNVNNISTSFYNESESVTDWQNFYIPFKNTEGFFEQGKEYYPDNIIYASGSSFSNYTSGWYYYSGTEPTSSTPNGPVGSSSKWTKDVFYFPVNKGIVFEESPRFYKQNFSNGYFIRVDDGINKSLLELNFTLKGRSDTEAKAIVHFLEKHRGKDQFLFTPPAPYDEQKVFVCPEWAHSINYKNNNSITVLFLEQPINYLSVKVEFLNLITIDPYLPST